MNDIQTNTATLTTTSARYFLSDYKDVATSTVKVQAGLVKSGKASSSDMIKTQMIVTAPYVIVPIAICITVCVVAICKTQKREN